ncbi:MAG: hypothetical protein DMG40_19320 [Acidobacteria bacterium]|nr:MAG: hypothetical protein DMG40_19320 [Acidobacteriota bacterium]
MASSFVDFLSGVLPRGVPVCIFLIKEPDNEPIRGEMRLVKAKARYLSPNKNPNRIPRGKRDGIPTGSLEAMAWVGGRVAGGVKLCRLEDMQ